MFNFICGAGWATALIVYLVMSDKVTATINACNAELGARDRAARGLDGFGNPLK